MRMYIAEAPHFALAFVPRELEMICHAEGCYAEAVAGMMTGEDIPESFCFPHLFTLLHALANEVR